MKKIMLQETSVIGKFENNIRGWWFSDEEVLLANKEGRLLTLDMDLGKACDLNCSFCFANTKSVVCESYVGRTVERAKKLLSEAAELGCRSIKIVGAGEPTMFPGLIEVLEHCKSLNIIPIIFTGGHIIGDDKRATAIFGKDGITSGLDLAKKLFDLGCSIIVKYMTLNDELNNKMVGANFNHAEVRDCGMINLMKVGFNQSNPTRLGVDCLLLKANFHEAVELFSFFNKLNIFCVINSAMDCGNTEDRLQNPDVLSKEEALEVAINLYKFCQREEIPYDKRGSPYFLAPVCSQLNHGMFVGDDNTVKACPGGPTIGKYESGSLEEIWKSNSFREACVGHRCISRCGKTYFADFEERVRAALER